MLNGFVGPSDAVVDLPIAAERCVEGGRRRKVMYALLRRILEEAVDLQKSKNCGISKMQQ